MSEHGPVFAPGALAGRVALVTGAQQGIGAAVAVAMAAAGADVVVNYLDGLEAARGVAAGVVRHGRRALLVQGDVSSVAGAQAIVAQSIAGFGKVDILVNNAGIFPRSTVLELEEAEWDQVLGVNLKGSFFCAQAAARDMVARGAAGVIINMSSITLRGTFRGAHYVASKGGVAAMSRAMALELAPHRIRVNAIAPGIIDTAQPRFGMSEEELEQAGLAIPVGRIGRPDEIADVAVFLASDAASFITGQTMHANGGAFMV